MLDKFPEDILQFVFMLLSPQRILSLRFVCQRLWLASNSHTEQITQIQAIKCAISAGEVNILEWMEQTLCWRIDRSISEETINNAAANGHINVLEWIKKRGISFEYIDCHAASANGRIEVLQWQKDNGCRLDVFACAFAAQNGHFKTLIWLRENGCSWNDYTFSSAAESGNMDILWWLKDNKCPFFSPSAIDLPCFGS